jgi:hypothetical protein
MLKHDELLPEEQANPDLIRELRTTYQMKPEAQQALSRVHERLAQSSRPIPLRESVRTEGRAPTQWFARPASTPYQPGQSRRILLSRFNIFAAMLFIVLLVGALALTYATIRHTTISITLVPAGNGSTPSQTQREAASALLSLRFNDFGMQVSDVSIQSTKGQPSIMMKLSYFGSYDQQAINILLQAGNLEFWDTGPQPPAPNTTFDPSLFTQYNPDGKPQFTGADLNPSQISVSTDSLTGQPQITCEMKGDAINRFLMFTSRSIGDALTITLDGKVLSSPIIQNAISGPFVIIGNFTQQQAKALATDLRSGSLPFALKQLG